MAQDRSYSATARHESIPPHFLLVPANRRIVNRQTDSTLYYPADWDLTVATHVSFVSMLVNTAQWRPAPLGARIRSTRLI